MNTAHPDLTRWALSTPMPSTRSVGADRVGRVLVALVQYADRHGVAFPGYRTLAADVSGVSERDVRNALEALAVADLIVPLAPPRRGRTTRWRINCEGIPAHSESEGIPAHSPQEAAPAKRGGKRGGKRGEVRGDPRIEQKGTEGISYGDSFSDRSDRESANAPAAPWGAPLPRSHSRSEDARIAKLDAEHLADWVALERIRTNDPSEPALPTSVTDDAALDRLIEQTTAEADERAAREGICSDVAAVLPPELSRYYVAIGIPIYDCTDPDPVTGERTALHARPYPAQSTYPAPIAVPALASEGTPHD